MKKFISTMASILMAVFAMAQAPDIMNYQAVARNNSGQALANQTIKVRLSVVKNAVSQYSETRQVTTNALGLFNVQIGSPGALSTNGSFAGINWQNNSAPGHVLKVELDINNSGLFTDMGSQALVSVPYALASKTAAKADIATETMNIAGRPIDQSTPPATGSRFSWNGTSWTAVKKDTVINLSSYTVNTNMFQSLSWRLINATAPTVLLNGGERVVINLSGGAMNASSADQIIAEYAICYINNSDPSNVIMIPLVSQNVVIDAAMNASNPGRVTFSCSSAITLPAGSYKFGLGVRNLHPTLPLTFSNGVNGTIEIKY